jgi:hypothetical protein
LLAWLTLTASLAATPYAGLSFDPLSRADLAWVDDDRATGLSVGEFDGVVRPGLQAFAGSWLKPRWALQGSLGIARLTTSSWVGDVYRQRHWGVIRPSVDVRYGFGPLENDLRPWLIFGLHGDIPSARDVSNGYTDEEQQIADENAYEERLRLGGGGGRLGAGLDYRVRPQLKIGALYVAEAHWGVLRSEDASTISSWVASRTSILVTFEWPPEARRKSVPADT